MRKRAAVTAAGLTIAGIICAAAAVIAPVHADAAVCGLGGHGPIVRTSASFTQQVSWDYCDTNRVIRVGIFVQPFGGYAPSHIKGCWAHLELTDTTLGSQTRSDRGVSCTIAARTTVLFTAGPASWSGQDINHIFVARAFVNIETTGGGHYTTEGQASTAQF